MFLFTIFSSVLKSAANKIKRNRKSPVLATPRSVCLIRFTASILRLSYVGIIQIRFTGRRAYLPLSLSGFITKPCKLPCIFNFDSFGTTKKKHLFEMPPVKSIQNHFPTLALPKSGSRVEGHTFLSACPVLQNPASSPLLLYCDFIIASDF